MDFRELNYVIAIAQYQNITKAAEVLFVGQPTLSKFLKALENDLGVKLFQKQGRKYVLTYAGERYVEKAEQILRLKRDLDSELSDIIQHNIGVLKVGFPTMRCSYMLPHLLPAFQRVYPNIKVLISEGHSEELDSKILKGDVEIAFYSQPGVPYPSLEYEVLGEEELLLCTHKNHPIEKLAAPNPSSPYPKLEISDIKDEKIIMMLPSQRTGQIIASHFHEQGINFEDVIYTSNMSAIIGLVAAGYGIAFLFEPHLKYQAVAHEIDCYSFGPQRMVSNFVAAYRRNSYLSIYARDFIELVRRLYWEQ